MRTPLTTTVIRAALVVLAWAWIAGSAGAAPIVPTFEWSAAAPGASPSTQWSSSVGSHDWTNSGATLVLPGPDPTHYSFNGTSDGMSSASFDTIESLRYRCI